MQNELPDIPINLTILSPEDAVNYLISQDQVWATARVLASARIDGTLASVKIGKTYCYQLQALFDWLKSCHGNPSRPASESTPTKSGTSNGEEMGETAKKAQAQAT